jgi:hypothetical protein
MGETPTRVKSVKCLPRLVRKPEGRKLFERPRYR